MARISQLDLDVGRATSSIEFAKLDVTVRWTSREVRENLSYLLSGYLIEQDDGLDFIDMKPNGGIHWEDIGNLDDFVGTVQQRWIRPNGQASRQYVLQRNFDFGNQESGNEEYRGIATVVPEIRSDIRLTGILSANLG